MSDTEKGSAGTERILVVAFCVFCGWWNKMTLEPSSSAESTDKIHPRCWVCGEGPMTVIDRGKVPAHDH